MRRMLFTLCCMFMLSQLAMAEKADTVDSYSVYYNGVEIHPDRNGIITLKKADIKVGDSLTLRYSNDTPCTCPVWFTAESDKHDIIATAQGTRTFEPLKISISDLLASGRTTFTLFYFEDERPYSGHNIFLFRIVIE